MVSGWCCRALRSSRFFCSYTLLFVVEKFTSTLVCTWLLYIAQMCHNCPICLPKTYTFVQPFHIELEWFFQSRTVNDVSTYHKVNRDPMTRVEKKVTDHVKRLHSLGYVPDKLKDKLLPSYTNPPRCTVWISQGPQKGYFAQSSHLQHRVTNVQVGKGKLTQILSTLTGNTESFMKNSTEFVNSIRNLEIDDKDHLASFDVVSLFMSVPIDEALEITAQRLEEDNTLIERTPIPAKEIHTLAEICLKSTYFQYCDEFYEQIEGAAMGSPLSPIIANLYMYMEHFKQKALESAPLKPKIWFRYVDNTIAVWPHPQPASFLNHLYGIHIHQSIQFTMEEEDESQISFLDVMVKRSERKLSTMVPQKATHTDRYLHFHSHHHPRSLSGVVKNLKQRALNVCELEELENLARTFQMNGYPKEVI